MNRIALILLVALLVGQSVVQASVLDIVGPLTSSAFSCLASDGYQDVIVRAYSLNQGGSIDPNAVQTLQNAEHASLNPHIYMVICRNGDAVSQVDTVISSISSSLYGTVWIKVEPNTTPGCQWSNSVPDDNCAFITAAANQFIANGVNTGIFTTGNMWNHFFGSSCFGLHDLGVHLWYAYYDASGQLSASSSAGDFMPFGGWQYPDLKQVGGNVHVTLCNNPNWHAFIDTDVWMY